MGILRTLRAKFLTPVAQPLIQEAELKLKAGNKTIKSSIVQGKSSIPVGTVTRLLRAVEGKNGSALDRAFYQSLVKYEAFLNELERAGISPAEAVKELQALRPVKVKTGRSRLGHYVRRIAPALAKALPHPVEQIVEMGQNLFRNAEFVAELTSVLTEMEKDFGRNGTTHIKTNARVANPAAIAGLAKARKIRRK